MKKGSAAIHSTSGSVRDDSGGGDADGFGDLSDIISALERLADDIETSKDSAPQQLDHQLQSAVAMTSNLISGDIFPGERQREQRDEWLSELGKHGVIDESGDRCERGNECPVHVTSISTSSPSGYVPCIHDCEVRYCSASCRKAAQRAHVLVCTALKRGRLLRSMGLSSSETVGDELF